MGRRAKKGDGESEYLSYSFLAEGPEFNLGCNPRVFLRKQKRGFLFIQMLTKLLLIRHGQTDCNLQKRYSGFLDVDLNDTGRRQVECLHKRLKETPVHNVYSSDRRRAVHSARIIFKDFEIEKIVGLREVNFGVFEGLTYKQIIEKYPRVYKRWLFNPFRVSIPKGENLGDFQKRIIEAFKEIISKNTGKTVAVVCHGGVISMFMNSLFKLKNFWDYIPDSASLSIIEYKNNKPDIKLFNDTFHLAG